MANVETEIQQRIRLALGTHPHIRLFRNQVGQLPDPRTGRPVQFGLARGSADLIGWRSITITPRHCWHHRGDICQYLGQDANRPRQPTAADLDGSGAGRWRHSWRCPLSMRRK